MKCKELGMIQIDMDYAEIRAIGIMASKILPTYNAVADDTFLSSVEESEYWEGTEFEIEWDMSKFKKVDMKHKDGYKEQPVLLMYTVSGAF